MEKSTLKILFPILLLPFFNFAQTIDNTLSFRDIKDKSYFRFSYDNDYFGSQDFYYSQGFSFELASPMFRGNPVNLAFPKPKNSLRKYGLSFEHDLYTPVNITADSIIHTDRPYAAALMLKFFLISTDTIHHARLSATLSFGAIGPGVLGKQMQDSFHAVIDNAEPEGWKYQIRNDLLLNYELSYEKELMKLNDLFVLGSDAKLRIGTVNTDVSGGLTAVFGRIKSPYSLRKDRQLNMYGYLQGLVSLIGYDATLQGGITNRSSPHTIGEKDLTRWTFGQNFGIVVQWKRFYLEYSRSELSKQFSTGRLHKWGGFRIGYQL